MDEDHGSAGSHSHADLDSAARLLSIGIDVGSATSHFAVSELFVGKRDPNLARKPEVLHRHLLYQSPILLTPFRDASQIDATALQRFLRDECQRAGLRLDDMDTGALICTGEAARKDNAAAISDELAAGSGRFVCAIAGHHLEAVMGAHGSGAIETSRGRDRSLVLLDVGGGTAKRTVIQDGRIRHTAAINVGTRLLAWDARGRVTRMEAAGQLIAEAAGRRVERGAVLDDAARQTIAGRMAACLGQFLGLDAMDDLSEKLLLTDVQPLPDRYDLLLSGGLAEYFYGRDQRDVGDLGRDVSQALRRELELRFGTGEILSTGNGIRATVIGAGQFSLQVSGETVFLDDGLRPPLRKVPVHALALDWTEPDVEALRASLARALAETPAGQPCGVAFPPPPAYGYGAAQRLGETLVAALRGLDASQGLVLVFEHNVARTVGSALAAARLPAPFMCLDEVEVGDLDYLDVGEALPGEDYLPVVVKSLVFSNFQGAAHGH